MFRYLLIFVLYLLMSFGIPYLIQYRWDFFGANHVTPIDIAGLWFTIPIISLFIITSIKRIWK